MHNSVKQFAICPDMFHFQKNSEISRNILIHLGLRDGV